MPASSRLSTSARRSRCARPAPSAQRMASSRRRLADRASIRLATLPQAISSTTSTAPSSTQEDCLTSSICRSRTGRIASLISLRNSAGMFGRSASSKGRMAEAACPMLTPGFNFAKTRVAPYGSARLRAAGTTT